MRRQLPDQRTFDDLGTPLCDVTFVVLDLETTGGSAYDCEITEVGALKFRGGECLGTFQTLVNPGVAIPREIVYLTGITQAMVLPAPKIDSVMPALLEFVGDAVIVGHNVRFDMSFLHANAERLGYGRLRNATVDTCGLARRLVRDEVPNCALATLARHFRTATNPCHRALDDAKATAELFHLFLERATGLGVLALDDLLALPTTAAHPQASKLRWVASLPRSPGVYVFRDGGGRALYVGKAVDLRRRVRSYFAGDERRKIGPLLREARSLDHIVCANELHAAVLEVRMIQQLRPRYNRQAKNPGGAVYLKLTLDERFPRLSVVRVAKRDDGCVYLGPLASTKAAKLVAEAIESAVPLRRCTVKSPRRGAVGPWRDAPCAPAQLGVAACPCAGTVDDEGYMAVATLAARAMTVEPALVLEPLSARMRALAHAGRYEEAAAIRDRAGAFSRAIRKQWRLDSFRRAGRVHVEVDGEGGAIVDSGVLVSSWGATEAFCEDLWAASPREPSQNDAVGPTPRELADEVAIVAAWIESRAAKGTLRLVEAGGLWWPAQRIPTFEPVGRRGRGVRSAA